MRPADHIAAAFLQTATPFQPGILTQTPFRPVAATPTATPTLPPAPTPLPSTYERFGIDFSDTSQTIKTSFTSSNAAFHSGKPVQIAFRPGWPCEWANHRSCTSLHYQGQVVLVTTHSGVAGEGQPLRHALEGSWLNAAAFPMQQIRENLASLQNADVRIEQGSTSAEGIRVIAAVRVPAEQVNEYFSLPVNDALNLAAQFSTEAAEALSSNQPLLVIETCGWRHPEESIAPGTSSTSASVYLVIIGN